MLIVEDGTGLPDAEAYISVVDALTYHTNQGNTAWAAIANDTLREQALRRATAYITGQYRDRWAGSRKTITQSLDWPRYMVPLRDIPGGFGESPAYVSDTIVPPEVQRACAELALRASSGDLAPDLDRGILSETIGAIKTDYDPNSSQIVRYRAIDNLLKPLLKNGGGTAMVSLMRA